jgi:ribulose-phosphate 3-epimerase
MFLKITFCRKLMDKKINLSIRSKSLLLQHKNKYTMKKIVAPSILAADFANLQHDIEMINKSEAEWFHIDIMDGVFVPNISFGMPVLEAIKRHATKTIDVHLMIVDPDRYLKTFADLGANILTVHYEACTHLHRTIQEIKALGMKAGVALNPHTPVNLLQDIIEDVDLVCLMSVNPGFGGQSFIANTFDKIRYLKELIVSKNASTLIEIDGGVNSTNATELIHNGADVLVAGNFVFKSNNPTITISDLVKQINE